MNKTDATSSLPVKPRLMNHVCAQPVLLTWAVGALILDGCILSALAHGHALALVLSNWKTTMWLAVGLLATTGLGFFFGMLTIWPLIRWTCSRYNGAPLFAGDKVLVLTGPQKGRTVRVKELFIGQGGWQVAVIADGDKDYNFPFNIVEEYTLLKQ